MIVRSLVADDRSHGEHSKINRKGDMDILERVKLWGTRCRSRVQRTLAPKLARSPILCHI